MLYLLPVIRVLFGSYEDVFSSYEKFAPRKLKNVKHVRDILISGFLVISYEAALGL